MALKKLIGKDVNHLRFNYILQDKRDGSLGYNPFELETYLKPGQLHRLIEREIEKEKKKNRSRFLDGVEIYCLMADLEKKGYFVQSKNIEYKKMEMRVRFKSKEI